MRRDSEMADASRALGATQVAGAWVTRRGKAKRTMRTVAAAEIGGGVGAAVGSGKSSPQPTPETPDFGAFGYVGVSATELVLVKAKQGLTGLKMTDDVVGRVPRSDIISVDLGEGTLASAFTITLSSGDQWELEVARANRRKAEQVVAELAG
jgi:hypothetical protein